MIYNLDFHPDALSEWKKLDKSVREPFKAKLEARLSLPRVEKDRVKGAANLYKIKLRAVGFRLVYEVNDDTITVLVLSVGKRERNAAYKAALGRL